MRCRGHPHPTRPAYALPGTRQPDRRVALVVGVPPEVAVLACFPVLGRCADNGAGRRVKAGCCERGLDAASLGVRSRWRAWLGLAVLIGLAGGATAEAAAGARRTETAYPRFVQAQNGYQLVVRGFPEASTRSGRSPGSRRCPRWRSGPASTRSASWPSCPPAAWSRPRNLRLAPISRAGLPLNRFKVISGRGSPVPRAARRSGDGLLAPADREGLPVAASSGSFYAEQGTARRFSTIHIVRMMTSSPSRHALRSRASSSFERCSLKRCVSSDPTASAITRRCPWLPDQAHSRPSGLRRVPPPPGHSRSRQVAQTCCVSDRDPDPLQSQRSPIRLWSPGAVGSCLLGAALTLAGPSSGRRSPAGRPAWTPARTRDPRAHWPCCSSPIGLAQSVAGGCYLAWPGVRSSLSGPGRRAPFSPHPHRPGQDGRGQPLVRHRRHDPDSRRRLFFFSVDRPVRPVPRLTAARTTATRGGDFRLSHLNVPRR